MNPNAPEHWPASINHPPIDPPDIRARRPFLDEHIADHRVETQHEIPRGHAELLFRFTSFERERVRRELGLTSGVEAR